MSQKNYSLALSQPETAYTQQIYTRENYYRLPQILELPADERKVIDIVSRVFPFKANDYVVNELIDWNASVNDPIYRLVFPQRGMLTEVQFTSLDEALARGATPEEQNRLIREIHISYNPHPSGQLTKNIPSLDGARLNGIQHKYNETVLFFPTEGQNCYAFCTFCFRWPQFTSHKEYKISMRNAEKLSEYIQKNRQVTDLVFTGGDPLFMNTERLSQYVDAILRADPEHLHNFRFGTRALSFWPYRFLTDDDADDLLRVFERIIQSGRNISLMAHFNHPNELQTEAVREAIVRIQGTGAVIRTQSPIIAGINDQPEIWAELWKTQVQLGLVPYYMFIARNTGPQHFFGVPLLKAHRIFKKAYRRVGGLARTVRGPVMSCDPGKVHVVGESKIGSEKVMVLQFLQGRNQEWVKEPFFARHNPEALWIDDLQPLSGADRFFFETE